MPQREGPIGRATGYESVDGLDCRLKSHNKDEGRNEQGTLNLVVNGWMLRTYVEK